MRPLYLREGLSTRYADQRGQTPARSGGRSTLLPRRLHFAQRVLGKRVKRRVVGWQADVELGFTAHLVAPGQIVLWAVQLEMLVEESVKLTSVVRVVVVRSGGDVVVRASASPAPSVLYTLRPGLNTDVRALRVWKQQSSWRL